MLINQNFKDYRLLDAGDKEKLEMWNGFILRRPDPNALWPKTKPYLWDKVDAYYHRSSNGGGSWQFFQKLPKQWFLKYGDLTFKVAPTDFKHTGLFPEQASNWQFLSDIITGAKKEVKVLNLFAYTGAATMVSSFAGAQEVVHVDAAKGMVNWAKENMHLSHLENRVIRFIVDDCLKFMQREIKRGHRYDIILMDPPSYGRGPNNELFRFEDKINNLLSLAFSLLSIDALCLMVSSYTAGYSPTVLSNLFKIHAEQKGFKGEIVSEELGLQIENTSLALPCGLVTRFLVK